MPDNDPTRALGRKAVAFLGLTQVIGFGTIYYPFGILAESIAQEFGWSKSGFVGVFSLALCVSGFITPFVGRAFDRYGAPPLMAAGSALCAAMLALMAVAPNGIVFAAGLIALQLCGNLVLYDAAFTALVQIAPARGERRIAYLTLIAGFASTVFWPLTTWLLEALGWRGALLVFAALNATLCLSAHLILRHWVRRAASVQRESFEPAKHVPPSVSKEDQGKALFLLTLGFVLSSIALSAVLALMVPMLQGLGYGAHALLVSTLFGPAQVVVRFTNLVFGSSRHPLQITIFSLALLPLGIAIGALFAPSAIAAVAFAVLIGMCSGLKSIVQGALPLRLFGSEGYGARQGFIASFRYVASAAAPFGYALGADSIGPTAACLTLSAIGVTGVLCMVYLGAFLKAGTRDSSDARAPAKPDA